MDCSGEKLISIPLPNSCQECLKLKKLKAGRQKCRDKKGKDNLVSVEVAVVAACFLFWKGP